MAPKKAFCAPRVSDQRVTAYLGGLDAAEECVVCKPEGLVVAGVHVSQLIVKVEKLHVVLWTPLAKCNGQAKKREKR